MGPGRGPLTHVSWYGGRILTDMEARTMAVVGNVTKAAASEARANHPWQNRTGQLEDSIFAAEPEYKGEEIVSFWGAHFPALFLEYGTVKMPAYPFLRPAFDKVARLANFAGAIRHELSASSGLESIYLD
jgi:HK97 gp10 family phage protein